MLSSSRGVLGSLLLFYYDGIIIDFLPLTKLVGFEGIIFQFIRLGLQKH